MRVATFLAGLTRLRRCAATARQATPALVVTLVIFSAGAAYGEPMFLSKQYARCAACHYSPTGGGLLTAYGRSLSHRELSTTGADAAQPVPPEGDSPSGEQAFLWGALGSRLGALQLGIEMRPSHLNFQFPGFSTSRDLWMNADVIGAYQTHGWTFYGEVGRQPTNPEGWEIDSYEYWIGRQPEEAGFGFRAGRFLPAYGVRFADHTAYNRAFLGFDTSKYDQVYGLEVSHTREKSLVQLTLSPGTAESIINGRGRRAFTAMGRFQFDMTPRAVIVASGLFRDRSDRERRSGASGVALGFAPISRVTFWMEADAQWHSPAGPGGPTYIVVNETAVEAYRGLWLKLSPQFRSDGLTRQEHARLAIEADLLPRTHWNVNLSYYRDRNRTFRFSTQIFLAQLHMYL